MPKARRLRKGGPLVESAINTYDNLEEFLEAIGDETLGSKWASYQLSMVLEHFGSPTYGTREYARVHQITRRIKNKESAAKSRRNVKERLASFEKENRELEHRVSRHKEEISSKNAKLLGYSARVSQLEDYLRETTGGIPALPAIHEPVICPEEENLDSSAECEKDPVCSSPTEDAWDGSKNSPFAPSEAPRKTYDLRARKSTTFEESGTSEDVEDADSVPSVSSHELQEAACKILGDDDPFSQCINDHWIGVLQQQEVE